MLGVIFSSPGGVDEASGDGDGAGRLAGTPGEAGRAGIPVTLRFTAGLGLAGSGGFSSTRALRGEAGTSAAASMSNEARMSSWSSKPRLSERPMDASVNYTCEQ